MLAALSNTTPDEAERLLQELSAQTGIKPRHVAELIIEFARTGRLCADLREELEHQLAQRRVPPTTRLRWTQTRRDTL